MISPLGLPIDPIWEYLIFLVIGEIVHEIAFAISPGGQLGSPIYWVTKSISFIIIWFILYVFISVIKFVISYWIWFVIGIIVLATIGTTVFVLFKKRKMKFCN